MIAALPAEQEMQLYRGDKPAPFTIILPYDLTGAAAKFTVKTKREGGEVLLELNSPGTLELSPNSPEAGKSSVRILAVPDDAMTSCKVGYYDLQITYPNGNVATYLRGTFRLVGDIS